MGIASTLKPFEDQKFYNYLIYAMKFEYEPFDETCIKILSKAAYILEMLISISENTAFAIFDQFNVLSELGKIMEKYFISSESPL